MSLGCFFRIVSFILISFVFSKGSLVYAKIDIEMEKGVSKKELKEAIIIEKTIRDTFDKLYSNQDIAPVSEEEDEIEEQVTSDEEEEEEEESPPPRKHKKKKQAKRQRYEAEEEDTEDEEEELEEDTTSDEEDDDEERPVHKKRKKPVEEDDEEEDDSDDEEDEDEDEEEDRKKDKPGVIINLGQLAAAQGVGQGPNQKKNQEGSSNQGSSDGGMPKIPSIPGLGGMMGAGMGMGGMGMGGRMPMPMNPYAAGQQAKYGMYNNAINKGADLLKGFGRGVKGLFTKKKTPPSKEYQKWKKSQINKINNKNQQKDPSAYINSAVGRPSSTMKPGAQQRKAALPRGAKPLQPVPQRKPKLPLIKSRQNVGKLEAGNFKQK